MRVAIAVAMFFSCSPGIAQVNAPATGASQPAISAPATSMIDSTAAPAPPGENAAQAALGGAGVPLGTTELFAGGLSPAPTDATGGACPTMSLTPGVGSLGTGAIFSGDGTLATSPSDVAGAFDSAGSGCGTTASAAVGPLGAALTTGAAATFAGGNIPLGATGLSTTGLGGGITLPAPASTIGSAVGSTPACSATGAPSVGLSSPLLGSAPTGTSTGIC